jgi:hypothetical protein
MNLREMLNAHADAKPEEELDEVVQAVVDMYEKQADMYKKKSVSFLLRITADQLGMKYEQVQDILEKYYSDDV